MDKKSKGNPVFDSQNQDDRHCEKVRHIIEQKPAFIVRWGNTFLLIVFLLIFLALGYWGFIGK